MAIPKRNGKSFANKTLTVFLGGAVLGAILVMLVIDQNQGKRYSFLDVSVTKDSSSPSTSTTTAGCLRAAQPTPSPLESSDASDEETEPKPASNINSAPTMSYAMASRDSGGFFDDISDAQWELMKQRVKERTNYFDPNNPERFIRKPQKWYQENFEPDFTCSHERRIGGMGDGPKWVCDPHRLKTKKDCLIYSVGSDGNFMFENATMKEIGKHCEIHTFDPEIQGRQYAHLVPDGVHYHNWGFMSETEGKQAQAQFDTHIKTAGSNFKTMKETIETLGHTGRVIDVFKIDCEGCEWTTFKGWFNAGATLRQVLVEVHKTPPQVHDFFLGMQQNGYVTFHKEPNTFGSGGKDVEYAFLKLEDSFFN